MMRTTAAIAAAWAVAVIAPAAAQTPRPAEAELYIISPADGAEVTSPFTVRFGLRAMGVAPAGIEMPDTGHHHLLIDVPMDAIDLTASLLADERHRHFGGGQTEASLDLVPGTYELRLLLADHNHRPHSPPLWSEPVTVTVVD